MNVAVQNKKAPSVVGGRFHGIQIDSKSYKETLSFSCFTETSPIPTTEVAEMGLRFDLASIRILALSLNMLDGILLFIVYMSMIHHYPFGYLTIGHLKNWLNSLPIQAMVIIFYRPMI